MNTTAAPSPTAGSVRNDQKLIRPLNEWDLAEPGVDAGKIFEQIADHIDSRIQSAAPKAAPAPLTDDQRETVRDALSATLGDAMDCTRVWSAWGVGTMSEDDFQLVADNDERLEELVSAIDAALTGQKNGGEGA